MTCKPAATDVVACCNVCDMSASDYVCNASASSYLCNVNASCYVCESCNVYDVKDTRK